MKQHWGTDANGRAAYFSPPMCVFMTALFQSLEDAGHPAMLFQGGFMPYTSYSAGTHGADAADIWVPTMSGDWTQRYVRDFGGAAFHRLPIPNVWGEHVHLVPLEGPNFHPQVTLEARAQRVDYYAHRDGLAYHQVDNSFHPSPQPLFNPKDYDMADEATKNDIAHRAVSSHAVDIIAVPPNSPYAKTHPSNKTVTPGAAFALMLDYQSRIMEQQRTILDRIALLEGKLQ